MTPQTFELAEGVDSLRSGHREYEDGPSFFTHFEGCLGPERLTGLNILDLGCGYGGRTVYYANDCRASHVEGVEVNEAIVDRCRRLAERLATPNVSFKVGFAEDLPYPDGVFDAVISYDVLEHVRDPVHAVGEIRRVLRPDGVAWVVFPTYKGARSSHLDYLTLAPALHRVFDPAAIVDVVNEFLCESPNVYGTQPQPAPEVSTLGRLTLPMLNGMTLKDARWAIATSGLQVEGECFTPFIDDATPVPGARLAASALRFFRDCIGLPELLIAKVAYMLHKPLEA